MFRSRAIVKMMTFAELDSVLSKFNQEHDNGNDYSEKGTMYGYIVYKEENWKKRYPFENRCYRVSNHNKRFQAGMISNSYSGDSIDGKDEGVRLDWYYWEIDFCFIELPWFLEMYPTLEYYDDYDANFEVCWIGDRLAMVEMAPSDFVSGWYIDGDNEEFTIQEHIVEFINDTRYEEIMVVSFWEEMECEK